MVQQKLVSSEKTNNDDGIYQDEPELRFPEFNEKWNVKTIKSVAQVIGGGTPKTDNVQYWDGEINWFTPSEIGNKYIFDSERKITEEGLKKSSAKLLPINSILLSTRATIGETSIIKKESTTNQGFQSLVVKENYNYEFIYYLIQLLKNEMLKRSSGSTFLEISKKEVEKILIKTPNLDEQNKIAQFLSAVDKKIELLEKKQNALENYFSSLRTRLFQQNLRFENNFGEWEQKKLKDIGEIITGNTPSTKHSEYYGDEYNWITPSDITDSRFVKESERKLSEDGFKKSRFVPENSILVTCIASIGKNCLTTEVCAFNQQINGIIPSEENDANFIYYLMEHYSEKLVKYAGITATPILNKKSFSNMEFEFPDLQEQRKISDCLITIDDMKELNLRKISIMNKYKKGLLQKMFV